MQMTLLGSRDVTSSMAIASWNKHGGRLPNTPEIDLLTFANSVLYSAASETIENSYIFGGHLENDFFKNAQHLQAGIHRIWSQYPEIDQNRLKNIIYVEKQGSTITPMEPSSD